MLQKPFFFLVTFFAVLFSAVRASYLRSDPDTTCSDTYRKDPTKDTCLATNDHFGRPCEFCSTKNGDLYCYNADQAKWAKLFGGKCQTQQTWAVN